MESQKTRVTVLMPVYNGEKFLRVAIDSILNQTYQDFEFLIIDDGSVDQSRKIILSYSDSRIQLIRNSENLGVERTLNKGIKLAKGKYIARMDCDDISLPQRLQKQVDFMDANPIVAVCGSWVETFGDNKYIWKFPLSNEEIRCGLLFSSVLAHPSVVLRKALFADNEFFYDEFQRFERAEDYDLWVRLSQKHKLANIGEVLLKYRLHESNVGIKYRSKTIVSADQIRKDQLRVLGVDFSEEEFDLHSRISRWQFEKSKIFLQESEKWLSKLLEANHQRNIYPVKVFAQIIAQRFYSICLNASCLGKFSYRTYFGSNLSQARKKFFLSRVNFLRRSLFSD